VLLSAELRFLTGEWGDARAELESGLRLAENGQRISVAQSLAYQALMALSHGDVAAARRVLRDVEHQPWSDDPCYGAEMVGVAFAALEELDGRPERALEVLLRVWELDRARGVRIYGRWVGPRLTRLAVAAGRPEAADVVRGVEEGAALAPEVASVQSAALRCRGLLEGDPDRLVAAVELARASPRLLDHASACEDAARALVLDGRPKEASDLLLEAHARYDAVDATAFVARTAAELRALGVRPGARGARQRPAMGWDSLTSTQEAVSRLVAEGLTNRAVAQRLFISPHPVNTHLRHVFQKLSVSTRAELAAQVARRDEGGADHASE
jgi:DNA-binding CsgD family transcriptional regulator